MVAVNNGITNGMVMPPVNTAATSAAWPAARVQRQRLLTRFDVFEAKMYPLESLFSNVGAQETKKK
jgi:hypothetical protein